MGWLCGMLVLLLLTSGCAVVPDRPDRPADFDAEGRMAVRSGSDGFTASFTWQQWDDQYQISMWGPFGQGRTTISGNARRLVIFDGRGERRYAGAPGRLMRSQLGWSLPLAVLPTWLQGQPADGYPVDAVQADAQGRLTYFDQLGWRVELDRYQDTTYGVRPARLKATGEDARITVSIRRWAGISS